MTDSGPVRVAIIGGGCAGLSTAFELSRPQHEGRFEVTVFQQGWRLGGKGASGRGVAGRIEEHGLHLWMGFYENAFRLMRECYAELGRDPARCPITTFEDAFKPDHFCALADRNRAGEWLPWTAYLPPFDDRLPGDPHPHGPAWSVADYLSHSLKLVATLFSAIEGGSREASFEPTRIGAEKAAETMARLLKYGELAGLQALIEGVELLNGVVHLLPSFPQELLLRFHAAVVAAAKDQLRSLVERDDANRRLWEIADLVLAAARGIVRHRLTTDPRGFSAIDDYDCRQWLLLNGASEEAVDSAFVRALYDLAFAYEGGDISRPRIAAGQALRGALRAFFTYRGAFFWKMQAGMGDIVFAPLYEVLRRRRVRFEFFHRLRNVRLAPETTGESYVQALEFDVQAELRTGTYEPLVDVSGLPCWPARPDHAQLVDGDTPTMRSADFESAWDTTAIRKRTLVVANDFDFVVLAVGIGEVTSVCRELVARDPRYRHMAEHCKSVGTQAFQIWLSTSMADAGWTHPPVNLSGFVEPFDTWADMSHLARVEQWPVAPKAIAYFCSVLPDASSPNATASERYPAERREEVRQNAMEFLDREIRHLWPHAVTEEGGFPWHWLLEPTGATAAGSAEQRFDSQFWTANVNPTDRYALSLPGSLKYRISPLDDTFDNFTVAGDWTDCGFNEGCVEAAVMSGLLAAHALSRSPRLEDIIGFDHP